MLKKHIPSTALGGAALFLIQEALPPHDFGSYFGLILGIGLLFLAVYVWRNENEVEEIVRALRGGTNFCYFQIQPTKTNDVNAHFQLWMTGHGGCVQKMNYWVSPLSSTCPAHPKAADPYYSLDYRKPLHEIIHEGTHASDRSLPVGEYRIDFDALNGSWTEALKLYIADGELKQSIKVTRNNGLVLYDSEAPSILKKNWRSRLYEAIKS